MNRLIIPNKDLIGIFSIIFNKKVSWIPYIKNMKKVTAQKINIIKILSHTTWGSK